VVQSPIRSATGVPVVAVMTLIDYIQNVVLQ
jgi:hypothetical protein